MFFDDLEDLYDLHNDSDADHVLDTLRTYQIMRNVFGGDVFSFNTPQYYEWSERSMSDSHLLSYTPVSPMFQRTNSINGGHWFIIQSLQEEQVRHNEPGWLEATHVIGHKSIYELSRQITLLLEAWTARLKRLDLDWSRDTDQSCVAPDTPGLTWFLKQRSTREETLSLEERAKLSVERGKIIFRSQEEFQKFYEESKAAVNFIPNLLMKIISEAVPVTLPYTALSLISKHILHSSDCCSLQLLSADTPAQLVESRYVGRLYLSLLDIHNVLTELMFRHQAQTGAPNFSDKFQFLRNIVQKNRHFLETYYQLSEENTDHHLLETKVSVCKVL